MLTEGLFLPPCTHCQVLKVLPQAVTPSCSLLSVPLSSLNLRYYSLLLRWWSQELPTWSSQIPLSASPTSQILGPAWASSGPALSCSVDSHDTPYFPTYCLRGSPWGACSGWEETWPQTHGANCPQTPFPWMTHRYIDLCSFKTESIFSQNSLQFWWEQSLSGTSIVLVRS